MWRREEESRGELSDSAEQSRLGPPNRSTAQAGEDNDDSDDSTGCWYRTPPFIHTEIRRVIACTQAIARQSQWAVSYVWPLTDSGQIVRQQRLTSHADSANLSNHVELITAGRYTLTDHMPRLHLSIPLAYV